MPTIVRHTLPVVDALVERIDELGLTYREAADQLGVSPTTIMNWKRGVVDPALTVDLQLRLADFLELPPFWVADMFLLDLTPNYPDGTEVRQYAAMRDAVNHPRRKRWDRTPPHMRVSSDAQGGSLATAA